jgi:hypothetical protein
MNNLNSQRLLTRKNIIYISIIIVSIVVFSLSLWQRNNAQSELNQQKSLLQQQKMTNTMAGDAALLLEKNLAIYKELQLRGIIGAPKRLQWLETIQHNADINGIPKLNMSLAPTEFTSIDHPLYHDDNLQTKSTLLQLTFSLLHEGDFYQLFSALQQQAEGVFNLEECSIRRSENQNDQEQPTKLIGGFNGSCDLRWYSIKDITQAWEVQTHEDN